jgi:hypothetical protein
MTMVVPARRGLKILLALLPFSLAVAVIKVAKSGRPPQPSAAAPWFEDLLTGDMLPPALGSESAALASSALFGSPGKQKFFSFVAQKDSRPRVVFLSISDGKTRAIVATGRGMGISQAMQAAITGARPILAKMKEPRWGKLDIVEKVRSANAARDPLAPGLEGLAFGRQSHVAFLPGQLMAMHAIDDRGALRPEVLGKFFVTPGPGATQFSPIDPSAGFYFTTKSWLLTKTETRVFQSPGAATPEAPTLAQLDENISLMASRFLASAAPDSDFRPGNGGQTTDGDGDTDSFESATMAVIAATTAFNRDGSARYLRLARENTDLMLEQMGDCKNLGTVYQCSQGQDESGVRDNSLLAIAIAAISPALSARSLVPQMRSLTNYVLWAVAGDRGKGPCRAGGNIDNFELCGTILYGLTRAIQTEYNGAWFEAASALGMRLAPALREELLRGKAQDAFWSTLAFIGLYRLTKDPDVLAILEQVAKAKMAHQVRGSGAAERSHELGPEGNPDILSKEVISLQALSEILTDQDLKAKASDASALGIRHLLDHRIGPGIAMYYENPSQILWQVEGGPRAKGAPKASLAAAMIAFGLYEQKQKGAIAPVL